MTAPKKAYTPKQLATDAIFCALIVVFSLLFASLAQLARSAFGVVIAGLIGIYFYKKTLLRCLLANAVITVLLLILQGPVLAVSVFLPNLLGGILLSRTYPMKAKGYYLVTAPVFALLAAGEFYLVSSLMLGQSVFANITATISRYEFIQLPQENLTFYLIGYFICFCIAMAGMKTIIARKAHSIFTKRFSTIEKHLQS